MGLRMDKDKITTVSMKRSTKDLLQPFKDHYGTYENGIIELINFFEHPFSKKKASATSKK